VQNSDFVFIFSGAQLKGFPFHQIRILPVVVFPFYPFKIEFYFFLWETHMWACEEIGRIKSSVTDAGRTTSLQQQTSFCCCQMCDMALCSWADEHQHRMTPMIMTKTMMMTVITVTMTILANFHRPRPCMDMSH